MYLGGGSTSLDGFGRADMAKTDWESTLASDPPLRYPAWNSESVLNTYLPSKLAAVRPDPNTVGPGDPVLGADPR